MHIFIFILALLVQSSLATGSGSVACDLNNLSVKTNDQSLAVTVAGGAALAHWCPLAISPDPSPHSRIICFGVAPAAIGFGENLEDKAEQRRNEALKIGLIDNCDLPSCGEGRVRDSNGRCVVGCSGGQILNASNRCVCPAGTTLNANEICDKPDDDNHLRNCPRGCLGGQFCNVNRVCACPDGQGVSDRGFCIDDPNSNDDGNGNGGDDGDDSNGCEGGSYETNGICRCLGGQTFNANRVCQCPAGQRLEDNFCAPIPPGEEEDDEEEEEDGSNGCEGGKQKSNSGVCVCLGGQTENANRVCKCPAGESVVNGSCQRTHINLEPDPLPSIRDLCQEHNLDCEFKPDGTLNSITTPDGTVVPFPPTPESLGMSQEEFDNAMADVNSHMEDLSTKARQSLGLPQSYNSRRGEANSGRTSSAGEEEEGSSSELTSGSGGRSGGQNNNNNGRNGNRANNKKGGGSSGSGKYSDRYNERLDDFDRSPQSLPVRSTNYGSDKIGVAQDNIFEIVTRAYEQLGEKQ